MKAAVSHVEVESGGPGHLAVSWSITGEQCAVDVAYGPTPEAIDHVHVRTVPAGVTSTALVDLGDGPHFVSVAPHGMPVARIAGERLVRFEGLQNFRDLGGYAAGGVGHTRWGLLFRADSLHKLTVADHLAFARLGLRVVFDLRGDRERETHPNPVDSIQLAVTGRPPSTEIAAEERERAAFTSAADGEQILRDLYVGMLVHSAPLFARLLQSLIEPKGLPAVFHCHAGKDRTGIVAALVLLAVGVSADDVLDDYELTRKYRTFENQQDSYANMLEMGMSPEAAAGVLATPRWAMEDALASLEHDHGGIERYLTGPVGLRAEHLDALRAVLVS